MNFKGNKSTLPSKICKACGRPMTWRKSWAKNWAEVRFCSAACRRGKPTGRLEAQKTSPAGGAGESSTKAAVSAAAPAA